MGASEGDKMYEELADMKKLRNVLSEVNTSEFFGCTCSILGYK